MKFKRTACLLLCLSALLVTQVASAQSPDELNTQDEPRLGIGGFGQIQGLFTLKASGPADLDKGVVFLLDGVAMAEDRESPFAFQFSTDSYPPGEIVR